MTTGPNTEPTESRPAPIPSTSTATAVRIPPPLVWDWTAASYGVLCALPAVIAMSADTGKGLALAVGVLPATISGMPARRSQRWMTAIVGSLVGISLLAGSVLATVPPLAVVSIFGLAVAAVLLAQRSRLGPLAVTLAVPLVGIGFSYTGAAEGAPTTVLMVAGSLYATVISLCWPPRPLPSNPAGPPPVPSLEYGVRLGGAGATAAAIGFALNLDHVGWPCGAALLVMRPSAEMQSLRSVGRLVSVVVGAAAAILLLQASPAAWAYSTAVVAALTAASATHRSRWYITSTFTTFLVFLLLLQSDVHQAASRFTERVAETLLGVAIAYLFGLAIPAMQRRLKAAT
jgi:hypothetical protein